jgi:hypothetical protein
VSTRADGIAIQHRLPNDAQVGRMKQVMKEPGLSDVMIKR